MAGFVKLDAGMLNSTAWQDVVQRNVLLTALLLAEPRELRVPTPTMDIDTGEPVPWVVPPGWYGLAAAAGAGIVHLSKMPEDKAWEALRRMAEPEKGSRSQEFEGRRMVRVEGGFIVLNFMRYRERDYTGAERQARYRARKAQMEKRKAPPRVKARPTEKLPAPTRIGTKADDALYNVFLMEQAAKGGKP